MRTTKGPPIRAGRSHEETRLFLWVSPLVVILASVATLAVRLSLIVGAPLAGLLIAETGYAGEVEGWSRR